MKPALTFRGPCIVICSYNKNQRDALISQICFGIELYMFRTGLLSIIRSLVLYTQQQVFVIPVMLTASEVMDPDLTSRQSTWQIPFAVYAILDS